MQWHQQQLVTLLVIGISAAAFANDELAELQRKLAPFRKLQESGPPAECLSACPTLSDIMTTGPENQDQTETPPPTSGGVPSQTEMVKTFQKTYTDLYGQMCQHKSAYQCLAANAAVCQGPPVPSGAGPSGAGPSGAGPSGAGPGGPADGLSMIVDMAAGLDCMCTACPSMPAAMGTLAGHASYMMIAAFSQAFSGLSGQDASTTTLSPETQKMDMFCQLVEPLKCVSSSSSCTATKAQIESTNSTSVSEVVSLESTCVQNGYALSPPAAEPEASGAWRVSGIFSLMGSFFAAFACMN